MSRKQQVTPRASVLVESMRDIGYSLETAVADVIDNSISAGATRIEILADTHAPAIGILDDGCGMSEQELIEAMRPGTRSPLDQRSPKDLGRFGLGLKTASFSQCRRVTVVSRTDGVLSCARWDLDDVALCDDWLIELPDNPSEIRWSERIGETGTLVLWEKLDRLAPAGDSQDNHADLVERIDSTARHTELVFHRFISGEPGRKRTDFFLNGRQMKPFDPFNSGSVATQFMDAESFSLGGEEVLIQAVTLPHHNKVSRAEWERLAGPEGYLKNQGFYLYRNRRLIIHGTWFGLARQTELTKLCRVRIDMPTGLDAEWKIDVKKASAQLPGPIRDRLRRIVERLGSGSRRAYTGRGARLVSDNRLPVWTRTQRSGHISYGLNDDHPAIAEFSLGLNPGQRARFSKVLGLIATSIPIDALIADVASGSEALVAQVLCGEDFVELINTTYNNLHSGGLAHDDIETMLSSASPFRENWLEAAPIVARLGGKAE